ncbi:MAG: histidine kinase [Fluviicola sp.]|nr:histidine kinase [Fluviicola sp.]
MIFFLFALLLFQSKAQQPAYFLFAEEQFEGIDIYSMIQDRDHNYWFATDEGIYKHDGYSFSKIECDAMKGGSVYNFVINRNGVIYCINLNQQVFQIKNSICTQVFEIPDTGNDMNLLITNDNQLFISTSRNDYLLGEDNQLIQSTKFKNSCYLGHPFLLSDGSIIQHESRSDSVLVFAQGKSVHKRLNVKNIQEPLGLGVLTFFRLDGIVYALESQSKRIYRFDERLFALTYLKTLPWNPINESLRYYSLDDHLWIGSNISGIGAIDAQLKPAFSGNKCFNDYLISTIYKDHEGNYLFCTFDHGILVAPDLSVSDVEPQLAAQSITRFCSDKNIRLYLGNQKGQILVRENGSYSVVSEQGDKQIETFFFWAEHAKILSDVQGFSLLDVRTNQLTHYPIGSLKDVVPINRNRLLLAFNLGVFFMDYDEKADKVSFSKALLKERTYSLGVEKRTGYVYISSVSGLKYMDPKGTIRNLLYRGEVISVTDILGDGDKTYISTRKHGIICFSKGKPLRRFTPKRHDEVLIVSKLQLHRDRIYANTQIGLVVLDLKGNILHYINKSSGLSKNRIIDFHIHDGELWVTHSRGVQRFDLNRINSKIEAPQLMLSRIFVNDVRQRGKQGMVFDPNQKKFRFVFQVATLKNRDNIRYHYQLKGLSNEWLINAYANHDVTYNSLAPGDYVFTVKAENNGVFSPPIRYSFSVAAPFYQKWWFTAGIVLLALGIVTMFFRRQLAIQRKKAQQINELNASRLTAIQSQMNPHFIFNSLNSIQDLVLKGDIDNSYTFITKFSNLVRRTLNYSDKDFIEFEQEIKLIELYLSLEKLRFKEDLVFTIETNGIEDIFIPPMLIQPFIENALVHGLLHKEGRKELLIRFHLNESLICEITDNGVGRKRAREIKARQRSQHESFSVNAIKRRFEILGDHFQEELGFTYEDLETDGNPSGTRVTLKLPTKHKY